MSLSRALRDTLWSRNKAQSNTGRITDREGSHWVVTVDGRNRRVVAPPGTRPKTGDVVRIDESSGQPYISRVLGASPRREMKKVWIDG